MQYLLSCDTLHQQVERSLLNISENIMTQSTKISLEAHFEHNSLTQSTLSSIFFHSL